MPDKDLAISQNVDLASVQLDYGAFRQLALNPNLSHHERIGFPDSYREGFEADIYDDICSKLPLFREREKTVVDIGPGCANLPRMIIDACAKNDHRLVLVDSEEMLRQLPDGPHLSKVRGFFPTNSEEVRQAAGGPIDIILCYSVLHYLFVETNPFHVIDTIVDMLDHGGMALLGDIPNLSKRNRFFASPRGVSFHQEFTGTDQLPPPPEAGPAFHKIDDGVLAGLVHRAQLAGCDAYIVPQPATLPMSNRRDDLLLRKP
ncbi:methyltransferase type 12 [Microvirga sp. BSC39]|uniref:methyltransferase type 12 n=1 Tax=Microvirga sp. BSC39 TaxID=1549810 RepID=UPI0005607CA3|nr:methyltransferase type 12 [Microvirga sp. BSC39]